MQHETWSVSAEATANIIRKENPVLFEHGTFPLNILITLVFMHMHLLS